MLEPDIAAAIRAAERDPSRVVVEGFHALKHALRFGATIELLLAASPDVVHGLVASHAPDLADTLLPQICWVEAADLAGIRRGALTSPVVAIARRPRPTTELGPAPIVLLEQPSHLGNLGACVRVAAGLGAAAVWTLGTTDPWHPIALRGSAGLHFALPVEALPTLETLPTDRPLVAFDPEGEPLTKEISLASSILAFGSERRGLSADLRSRATRLVAIPMRPKISSLNLATSVAIALWHWRLVDRRSA